MLGLRIAILRRARGWSQAELARRLKISPSTVGMYEQGRREPALEMVVAMTELFGVTADYLITGRISSRQDGLEAEHAFRHCMEEVSRKTEGRRLSRQEMAVLLAAALTEE